MGNVTFLILMIFHFRVLRVFPNRLPPVIYYNNTRKSTRTRARGY